MISVLFLILLSFLCIYFITNRNAAVLGYLVFFQEVHIIPLNNLGLSVLGYVYYIIVLIAFLYTYTSFNISKRRIKFIINDKVIWAIALLTCIILFHLLVMGLKSDSARILTLRFFLQVLPVIFFLVIALDRKKFIQQIAAGIIIFGILLYCILLFATDFLSMMFARGDFRDIVGMNPIAVTRAGGIVFITSFLYYFDKTTVKFRLISLYIAIFSLIIMVMSLSRGPVLGLIFTIIFFFFIKKGDLYKKILSLSLISILVAVSGIILYNYVNIETFMFLIDRIEGLQDYENMRRYRRLVFASEFISNEFSLYSFYFWFGMGPAGFAYYYSMGYVHNFVLEFILEYGFVGVISISLFTFYSFYYSIKIIRSRVPLRLLYIPLIFIFLFFSSLVSGDIIANRNLLFVAVIQLTAVYQFKQMGYTL